MPGHSRSPAVLGAVPVAAETPLPDLTYDPSEPMIPWGIALLFDAPIAILVIGVVLAILVVGVRRRRRGTTAGPTAGSDSGL